MTDKPVDLDAHRGFAAMKATEIRRQRLYEFQIDQEALRVRQEELEKALSQPAESWLEAAGKAQYLLQIFATTPEAQDPHRQALIARTLDDLAKLCERSKERP
ncbi:hypothetical protein AAFN88_15905 [Pelagibius sp. CAU 1746]|uniref:hypothetical protein n=1 Tax=Pelagibius sp. CAU 1746 TaxID=3140370 RepID=UPI00325AD574